MADSPCIDSVETAAFETALRRYIEESKPGRSIEQQLKEWSLHWEPAESTEGSNRSGCLSLTRNSVTIHLESHCEWTETTLEWICHAAAQVSKESKLKDRLHKDDYICKLLSSKPVLLEANILHSEDQLEERVDCKDDVAEGIRRAILPLADSALDVFEVLLALPFWPETNKLGHRARLRLLEDAMCNECEEQENEQAVEDLELGSPSSKRQKKSVKDDA
ncbi:hypothetical protein FisN_22Hh225 [Fistulifera solaris]|uniref:Uncharacterized protein n=1 Tax=Fistulifera solaris TaxID=1519565 RepID=A0A1Z5KPK4_FISSO|nr:hypothetical protein FisN_22Hh225 [Fistulifera solaris]|eukprot:GAX28199.1 hypothetical protein FisN_22Hh225 [Fistulifera solaris]